MSDANLKEDLSKFCPVCLKGGEGERSLLVASEGKLEQSGELHLPTTRWNCSKQQCVYQRLDGSTRPWRSNDVRDPVTKERLTRDRLFPPEGDTERVPA